MLAHGRSYSCMDMKIKTKIKGVGYLVLGSPLLLRVLSKIHAGCIDSGNRQQGAVAVEYAFSMVIAFGILVGVFELFRAMSIEIYLGFTQWVCQPFP